MNESSPFPNPPSPPWMIIPVGLDLELRFVDRMEVETPN